MIKKLFVKTKKLGTLTVLEVIPSTVNTVYLLENKEHKRYVYKKYGTNTSSRYGKLAKELKFLNIGVKPKKRTAKEIADIVANVGALGFKVPEIAETGTNYTIEEYIIGTSIGEIKDKNAFMEASFNVLNLVAKLHSKGIVLGDRWIRSQIIDGDNNVYFINFDKTYKGKGLEDLEMTETINALTFDRKFEDVVYVAESFIKIKNKYYKYNVDAIVEILKKHALYWSDQKEIMSSLIKVLSKKKI